MTSHKIPWIMPGVWEVWEVWEEGGGWGEGGLWGEGRGQFYLILPALPTLPTPHHPTLLASIGDNKMVTITFQGRARSWLEILRYQWRKNRLSLARMAGGG
ncbi:MAG: hypothetical protein F6J93_35550 [Oscillatoria sp. SIO1A7]|nr:hypothetical protein [Oscillatoria sp. SIO1A7]